MTMAIIWRALAQDPASVDNNLKGAYCALIASGHRNLTSASKGLSIRPKAQG